MTMNLDTKTYAAGFIAAVAAVMLPVLASLTLAATAVPNVA